ncbi:MAG: carbohydrate ABC transporter permease [Candidatus Dormibacteraceae bacterium]
MAVATRTGARRSMGRRVGIPTARFLVIALFALICVFPFIWAAITMFKADADLYNPLHNPFLFNKPATLEHLRVLFQQTQYLDFVRNTVVVGAAVVGLTLLGSVPAAYSLARLTGRWGEKIGFAIFVVYLVPTTLLFLPLSRVVALLGLQDTLWALVVIYPTFTLPLSTWLLLGFFKSIPRDIEEQAMVDGHTRVGAVIRTVLPLALPGLLTVVVFSFTLTMNDFIYALAFISTSSSFTISVGVPTALIRGDVFFWQSLMASTVIIAIPIALVYNLFLDRFVQGLALGAVKG